MKEKTWLVELFITKRYVMRVRSPSSEYIGEYVKRHTNFEGEDKTPWWRAEKCQLAQFDTDNIELRTGEVQEDDSAT
jgi:hypothetical protein